MSVFRKARILKCGGRKYRDVRSMRLIKIHRSPELEVALSI